MTRIVVMTSLAFALFISPALAERGLFSEGKQSFGLGLNGGDGGIEFSGGYGYFIRDGLKPETSMRFSYSKSGDATLKALDWEVGARYYVSKPEPISPLAHVFATVTRLDFSDTLIDGAYTHYGFGVAGGVFVLVGRAVGIEVTGGVLQRFSVDPELVDHDVVTDEIEPFYRIGISLVF